MKTGSEYKWPTFQVILKYFQGFMALVYVCLGIAILWKSEQLFHIPETYSIPLGTILVAYGIIRGYRIYQRNSLG
ncbi:MAG TPA: hypothetical protein VK517_14385 [Cyclobacteriaceae bacterium]|jgi:cadmium resistance protein CadD (predicted permease)|nr:hypothetical protein [Cyclobacteriaceae bacterium]